MFNLGVEEHSLSKEYFFLRNTIIVSKYQTKYTYDGKFRINFEPLCDNDANEGR